MTEEIRSSAELRNMFGANLRQLSGAYPTVSALCRQLGINRTQFNRYLSGESFPRPDVLDRICRFFDVDARILLKPLSEIAPAASHPAADVMDSFLAARQIDPLPAGFYHSADTDPEDFTNKKHRLLYVRHVGATTLLRGYEPRKSASSISGKDREIQGFATRCGDQVFALMSRRCAQDSRMLVLTALAGGEKWVGQVITLFSAPNACQTPRRVILTYLGPDSVAALRASRNEFTA